MANIHSCASIPERHYTIMRCRKLKSVRQVAGHLEHCYRENSALHIDKAQSSKNIYLYAQTSQEALEHLKTLLPKKYRKDAVITVEYLMTASREWFATASEKQYQEFFKRSLHWLAEKYGEHNIYAAAVNFDTTTPHLSAFVCPKTQDGRLCAKRYIGNIAQMSKDQTSFAEKMHGLGLTRGVKDSKARHTDLHQFYSALNTEFDLTSGINAEDLSPRRLSRINPFKHENKEQIAQRITAERIHPLRAKAFQYQIEKERSLQLEQCNRELNEEISNLKAQIILNLSEHSEQRRH